MAKKILILAATHFQIPVIEYARSQGHFVITCDNRPYNPGHQIADKSYNVSTTDPEGILEIARKEKIDGILAYGTDPAAPTAAYVADRMNLPGNGFDSVHILSDKGMFRRFLTENKFPAPDFGAFDCYDYALVFFKSLKKNVYVKPVDSSGSKGITSLKPDQELLPAFNYALQFSRKGEVVIESEIERKGPHIHGEAFVFNGKVVFMCLGDQYFSPVSLCAPVSTTVPSMYHADVMGIIKSQLSELIELSGFKTGGLNIEIIRDLNDRIYFMEIGARNGGNFMPELITMATGFNMAAANVNAALNMPLDLTFHNPVDKYFTQLILHSPVDGVYPGFNLNGQIDLEIIFRKDYYNKGDMVNAYKDSRHVLGVSLLKFKDRIACLEFLRYINKNSLLKIEI